MPQQSTRFHRREVPTLVSALASVLVVGIALAGCAAGSGDGPASDGPAEIPDYYPDDYYALVEAAEAEGGELTIYSSTDEANWAPVIEAFREQYPFVEKVSALNMESDEIFQRYLSEMATGNAPADMLVTGSALAWADFVTQRPDAIEQYESPEQSHIPDYGVLLPGVYAMAIDPQVLAYNTALIKDEIKGWGDLAAIIDKDPEAFKNKIGIRDPELSSFNFTVQYSLLNAKPELWVAYESFIPLARPEVSTGAISEKVLNGEYVAAIFATAGAALPIQEQSGGLFKLVIPEDGVVGLARGAGVPSTAPHPNTSKLFMDFLLSERGQQSVQDGGLSAYREGIDPGDGWTFESLIEEVGEDAIVTVPYSEVSEADQVSFLEKWAAATD